MTESNQALFVLATIVVLPLVSASNYCAMSPARVVRLLQPRCPSAIRRLVVAVIVDSVERQAWWPWTHVRKKRAEIVEPSVADSNASAPVILEEFCPRIEAAILRPSPRLVFDRDFVPEHATVLPVPMAVCAALASAAECDQAEVIRLNDGLGAAITSAQPSHASSLGALKDDQSSEAHPDLVLQAHISFLRSAA